MTDRIGAVAATVSALPVSARERFGPRIGARYKLEGDWRELTYTDPDEIVPWASEHGLPGELADLAEHTAVGELIQRELDRVNAGYAPVEQIKKFAILDQDLTIDEDELTPTLKVKRNVISRRYGDLFESLYGPG